MTEPEEHPNYRIHEQNDEEGHTQYTVEVDPPSLPPQDDAVIAFWKMLWNASPGLAIFVFGMPFVAGLWLFGVADWFIRENHIDCLALSVWGFGIFLVIASSLRLYLKIRRERD